MPRSSIMLANISNIRNSIDAIFLFAEPSMFIMKNIAITPMSQNMKNMKRLAEVNSPAAAIWKSSISELESLVLSLSGLPATDVASSTIEDIIRSTMAMKFILKLRPIPREGMYENFSIMFIDEEVKAL
jgi:hypothetical protein